MTVTPSIAGVRRNVLQALLQLGPALEYARLALSHCLGTSCDPHGRAMHAAQLLGDALEELRLLRDEVQGDD